MMNQVKENKFWKKFKGEVLGINDFYFILFIYLFFFFLDNLVGYVFLGVYS